MSKFNQMAEQSRTRVAEDLGCSQMKLGFVEASTNSRIVMAGGPMDPARGGKSTGTALMVRPKNKTEKPKLYKVIILNDDYTPMDFVTDVLKRFFQKSHGEAIDIMLQVHTKGAGVAGVYSHEIAETKMAQVESEAFKNEHPLKLTLEPE